MPTRQLGKTGHAATLFGLGGEGVLRTHGRQREAVAVIQRALDLGVNYCDTAPAYSSSMDYYGAALGDRRAQIFLASKTADRSRDGSLKILDDSLRRLRTDHLDLWQLHDLRTASDLEAVFSPRGAIHALVQAREEGRVRFLGLTGHHDPAVLLEAMRRFEFDTVLAAINVADIHRRSFALSVVPEAARRGMGVIGMKVLASGALAHPNSGFSPAEAVHYVLSLAGVSLVIIGCSTPTEVEANVQAAIQFQPLGPDQRRDLEQRARSGEFQFTAYKKAGCE
jgi:aryl-alcohol dehydrogenase-like predicted oxidoreductase